MILAALPLLGLALFVWIARARSGDWRVAALHGATAWGAAIVAVTEGLGAIERLTPWGIAGAWIAVDVAAIALALRAGRGAPRDPERLAIWDRLLLGGAGVVVLLVGVVAVLAPPNTWDAMQYHVPRVVHWLQNRTVAFYPTHELKQLHMPPGAEYAMLQLHALWGGDRLDNLGQWLALVGSVVVASLVARELGAAPRGQALAAVVCATIHESLLGASGSKNDVVLGFWLLALAAYALRFGRDARAGDAAGLGLALGLAWLTKGTSYVLAAPLLVALWLAWPRSVKLALVRCLPIVALLAVGLNAGHFARNHALHGSPLGPGREGLDGEYKYTNDVVTPASVLSNLVRNAAVHVRSEERERNAAIERGIARLLAPIGADPDDPRTNFFAHWRFQLPEWAIHEGFAGDPAQLALVLVTLAIAVATGRRPARRPLAVYALGVALAFVAFCAVFKWQPHLARLHAPLFALWAPAIGAAMGAAWPPWLARLTAALLIVFALPMAIDNDARPLSLRPASVHRADRAAQYFGDRRGMARDVLPAVSFVRGTGCTRIGLDLSAEVGDQYEYPWLALLGAGTTAEVRPIAVTNDSARYAHRLGAFAPCVVVCVRCAREAWPRYGGQAALAATFGDVAIFRPAWAARARWTPEDLRVSVARTEPPAPEPAPDQPAVRLLIEGAPLRVGDRLRIGLEAANPTGAAADLYVGIVLPGGQRAMFVQPGGAVSAPMSLADARQYPRAASAPVGFALAIPSFATIELTAPGRYRVFALLAVARERRGREIPPSDMVASTLHDVEVWP